MGEGNKLVPPSSSPVSETGVELVWAGKYTPNGELAAPEHTGAKLCIRTHHGGADAPVRGKIVLGDNLASMQALCDEYAGRVDLIYIDPPFATGGKFSVATRIGDEARPGGVEEVRIQAYNDAWPGGLAGFLAFLGPRLRLLHRLLSPTGSMYIHVDPTVGHAVKLVCDEVFGPRSFQREIVWRIGWLSGFKTKAKNWIRNHDLIFFYTKDPRKFTFNKHYVPHPKGYRRRDGALPKGPGMPIEDVWNANASEQGLRGRDSLDSIQIKSFSTEKTGWATQKNESLLRRIIEASSNPGDTVLDVFCGSGTTAVVAASLGRNFLACDTSALAIHMTRKRLLEAVPSAKFDVCTLDDRERLVLGQENWAERVVAHHGGEAITDPVLHGQCGPKGARRAVWVGPLRGRVCRDELSKAICAASEAGYGGLDALAWEYDPDAMTADTSGLDLQCYRLTRLLLDSRAWRRIGSGIVPHGKLVAAFRQGPDKTWSIELVGLAYTNVEALPPPLEVATRGTRGPALDAVDAWGVDVQLENQVGVWQPQAFFYRTKTGRVLTTRAVLSGQVSRVRVRVVDVLGASQLREFTRLPAGEA